MAERQIVLNALLEVVQGYMNRIEMRKPTIEEIQEWLVDDLSFLQQEFNALEINKILNV